MRDAKGILLIALVAVSVLAGPVRAGQLIDWDDLEPSELRASYLLLERPVELLVTATATFSTEEGRQIAYPWILSSETRKVVWKIDPAEAEKAASPRRSEGTVLRRREDRIRLDPGHYEVYFTTYGDIHRVPIGRLPWKIGMKTWFGEPSRDDWRLTVTCADARDRSAVVTGDEARPRFSPLLQIADPEPSETYRVPFRVDAPVSLVVYAIGEYDVINHNMADQAWIERASDLRRIWKMTRKNTRHAGGAEKNRRFRAAVDLAPGTYVLGYAADDSHSPGTWNQNPPYDPAFWGVALFDLEGARDHFFTDVEDPLETNRLVNLSRQVDNTFETRGIRVKRPITARVKAIGEHAGDKDCFVDFGWIEAAITHRTVWKMTDANTEPAGGAAKNRIANELVELQPGEYLVCNWTDDSHAYRAWNAPPPREPEAWGIQVWGVGRDFDPADVEPYEEDRDPRTVAQVLGIGDNRHAIERFELAEKTRVRIIAIGEGTMGQMFDYGWLQRTAGASPEVLWRMRYSETSHAGGAEKNRRQEAILELEPGTYELHYVTDDSHSFEDWNARPPDQPHLWGAAIYRD